MPHHAAKSTKENSFSNYSPALQQQSGSGSVFASSYTAAQPQFKDASSTSQSAIQLSAYQQMADNSSQVAQLKSVRAIANSTSGQVIQRLTKHKNNAKVGRKAEYNDQNALITAAADTYAEVGAVIERGNITELKSTLAELEASIKIREREKEEYKAEEGTEEYENHMDRLDLEKEWRQEVFNKIHEKVRPRSVAADVAKRKTLKEATKGSRIAAEREAWNARAAEREAVKARAHTKAVTNPGKKRTAKEIRELPALTAATKVQETAVVTKAAAAKAKATAALAAAKASPAKQIAATASAVVKAAAYTAAVAWANAELTAAAAAVDASTPETRTTAIIQGAVAVLQARVIALDADVAAAVATAATPEGRKSPGAAAIVTEARTRLARCEAAIPRVASANAAEATVPAEQAINAVIAASYEAPAPTSVTPARVTLATGTRPPATGTQATSA